MLGKLILAIETTIQRVAGFALTAFELKFGSFARNTNQADKLHLIILCQRTVEELILPIRAARHIKQSMRVGIALNHHHSLIVRLGGFLGRLSYSKGIGNHSSLQSVEGNTRLAWIELESHVQVILIIAHCQKHRFHGLHFRGAGGYAILGVKRNFVKIHRDVFACITRSMQIGPQGDRRILKSSLRYRNLTYGNIW